MKRRNSEAQEHALADQFKARCEIHDLQGLLMDSDSSFSAAVEAFTSDVDEPIGKRTLMRSDIFTPEELLFKQGFAAAVGVEFHVFGHELDKPVSQKEAGARVKNPIRQYYITKEGILAGNKFMSRTLTEDQFLNWWAEHKKTIQTKGHRQEFEKAVKDSYFDILLENPKKKKREQPKLQWGGNIDGFLASNDGQYRPTALIENRFSKEISIKKYNPAWFFKDDVKAWNSLFLAAKQLNVPLVLCVYSKFPGEENKIAMAEIDVERSVGRLCYKNNLPPHKNVFDDLDAAASWLMNIEGRSEAAKSVFQFAS